MAKILMFGNQKGGVGKSQCSLVLASALSQKPFNLRIALVDIDDQKSIVSCRAIDKRAYGAEVVAPYPVIDYGIADLQKHISTLDQDYQILLIDAAGKLDAKADVNQQEISKSLMYVDYLFLPFVAGNHNLDASFKYLRFVQQIQAARTLSNRQLTATGFVNMFRSRSRKNQFLLEDIANIANTENLVFMKTYLNDYALFSDADTMTSLYEPLSNDPARQNFVAWVNEICRIIGIAK
jgi:cellulose biosynthesis protein BcsQ